MEDYDSFLIHLTVSEKCATGGIYPELIQQINPTMDDIIPCDTCSEKVPLSLWLEHESKCKVNISTPTTAKHVPNKIEIGHDKIRATFPKGAQIKSSTYTPNLALPKIASKSTRKPVPATKPPTAALQSARVAARVTPIPKATRSISSGSPIAVKHKKPSM